MDLITATQDENLFKPWFKDPTTWSSWFVFIRALIGLGILTDEEMSLYTRCTGRLAPPAEPASEAWLVCGRRSGKSFILALVAVYLACFNDWTKYLQRGEVATIIIVATESKRE
jgi:hypothetical protein